MSGAGTAANTVIGMGTISVVPIYNVEPDLNGRLSRARNTGVDVATVETAREYTMDQVGPKWEALLHELWEERAAP
jgi:hypothetical protein